MTGATTDTLSYPAASNRVSNVVTGTTATRTFVHDAGEHDGVAGFDGRPGFEGTRSA